MDTVLYTSCGNKIIEIRCMRKPICCGAPEGVVGGALSDFKAPACWKLADSDGDSRVFALVRELTSVADFSGVELARAEYLLDVRGTWVRRLLLKTLEVRGSRGLSFTG